jgi:hypothetical protein
MQTGIPVIKKGAPVLTGAKLTNTVVSDTLNTMTRRSYMKKSIVLSLFFLLTHRLLFSQTVDVINAAIANGDCATLYRFVNDGAAGKDQRLLTSATAALRRYTTIDTGTTKYRTDKMDSRVRNVGRDLMEKIFIAPEENLQSVTAKLTTGVSDQFLKAKALHDWICDNIAYDVETAFLRANRRQDYASVLRNKKAVCAGYTNLFNQMCRLANIESIGISGYSKGFGYTGSFGSVPDHDWNAVKINSKWYLVDVTWDAGHVDQRTYIKNYSTSYLFLDSRPFLYSHLPVAEKDQFYAPPLTKEKFVEEPYIAGVYFRYGLELESDKPSYNNITDGNFTFDILTKNANVMLTSELRTTQQLNIDGASWQGRSGTTITFIYDVPDTREYSGYVFARLKSEKRIQERIAINVYETRILPQLDALFLDKKLTERECELFRNSYFIVNENSHYYFIEDQFATARNNAVIKAHPLLDLSLELMEPVLDFNIKAAVGYPGFGNILARRFPDTFATFTDVSNTKLVSPIKGDLTAGTAEKFELESKDFTRIAIVLDGEFIFFEKNPSGNFDLTFTIPRGLDELQIFGTKNNRNYSGLLRYGIVN